MSGGTSADYDHAIALRPKVDFVGKRNKRSKVCVFWAFQSRRGSKFRHEVRRLFYFLFYRKKTINDITGKNFSS